MPPLVRGGLASNLLDTVGHKDVESSRVVAYVAQYNFTICPEDFLKILILKLLS